VEEYEIIFGRVFVEWSRPRQSSMIIIAFFL